MSEYHIGRLIGGFRESKNISQQKLYYGIRPANQAYRLESEEREVSKLLVDTLLERMGLSTEIYGYEFPIKEYELFQWRADLIEFLEKGEYEEAKRLCENYEEKASKSDKLEQQFVRTIKLILALENEVSPEYLQREAEQILFLTVPNFTARKFREYLLSGIERVLIAIWAEALCRLSKRQDEGMDLFYNLLFYMEENCTDLWEQERQLPALVLMMVRWLWKWKRYSEVWICEKGIKVLRKSMRLTLLEPLMEYEMKGWQTGCVTVPEGESEKEWRKGLTALQEVRKEYQIETKTVKEYRTGSLIALMLRQNSRGQILGETVRRIRNEKNISVEELAEGICEPENLRKIELGLAKPRQKTYARLMQRLGQQQYAYHPLIYSDDYRMYECYQKVRWYINREEFERAEYELKKLESGLEKENRINYQVLLKLKVVINEKTNKINFEEKLSGLKKALAVTVPINVKPENWILSREEAILWNDIAGTLEQMGNRTEAIQILQSIKKMYDSNRVNNRNEYLMVLSNLSTFLGREGKHEQAIEIADRSIGLGLKGMQGNYLLICLYNKVWNTEKILEMRKKYKNYEEHSREKCIFSLKNMYNIANIMQYAPHKNHVINHCKEYYGISIEDL